MSTILLAWEVGAGLGHLRPHRDVLAALAEAGHALHVAARDPSRLRDAFGDLPLRPWQSPIALRRPERYRRVTRTFAEVLANVGFAETDALASRLAAWRNLVEAIAPDLLLCDYAPTALLAVRGTSVWRVVLSGGFCVPPDLDPLPPFLPFREGVDRGELAAEERRVRDAVNESLDRNGLQAIPSIGGWFNGVDAVVLRTYPELDHVPERTSGAHLGLPPTVRAGRVDWPAGERRRVFGYLKPFEAMGTLFELLRELRLPTVIFVDGIPGETRERYACETLRFDTSPVDLVEAAETAHFAITNANHATTAHFLLAGKPSVVIPLNLEQQVLALRLEELGAASIVRPNQPRDVYERLADVLNTDAPHAAARRFAELHATRPPSTYVPAVLERFEGLLGRG